MGLFSSRKNSAGAKPLDIRQIRDRLGDRFVPANRRGLPAAADDLADAELEAQTADAPAEGPEDADLTPHASAESEPAGLRQDESADAEDDASVVAHDHEETDDATAPEHAPEPDMPADLPDPVATNQDDQPPEPEGDLEEQDVVGLLAPPVSAESELPAPVEPGLSADLPEPTTEEASASRPDTELGPEEPVIAGLLAPPVSRDAEPPEPDEPDLPSDSPEPTIDEADESEPVILLGPPESRDAEPSELADLDALAGPPERMTDDTDEVQPDIELDLEEADAAALLAPTESQDPEPAELADLDMPAEPPEPAAEELGDEPPADEQDVTDLDLAVPPAATDQETDQQTDDDAQSDGEAYAADEAPAARARRTSSSWHRLARRLGLKWQAAAARLRRRNAGHPDLGPDANAVMDAYSGMSPQVLVISFFANLLGLALPLAILQIYDRILPNQSHATLTLLTLGLIAAFLLEASLKISRSYVLGWTAVHHGFRTQVGAVRRLLTAPRSQTERVSSTLWMDSLDALGELSAFEGGQLRSVLVDIPLAGIFLLVIALVGGPLAFVPCALIVAFGFFSYVKGVRLQRSLEYRSEQDNKQADFLVECLSGMHTLKGLAIEPQMLRRFERLQRNTALASYDAILFGNKLQTHGIFFANLMMVSVVTGGALMVMAGTLSVGALACCSLLSGRLIQPVLRGTALWTEIQNVELAHKRTERFDPLPWLDRDPAMSVPTVSGAITFDRVQFDYDGKGEGSLHDVSLDIRPGEFIGIRGDDGSGRSSFAKLIMGHIAPAEGSVTIDGVPAHVLASQGLNRHICYVSAKSAIFKGTILENMTMFRMGNAIAAARDAAQLIGLEQDIFLLPDGYDTQLGQGGVEVLSSGLLQRITIARALVAKPKILIFNEANSLLDFRSDQYFREGIATLKGEMTAILISNRPSLLNIANRVFELRAGRLETPQSAPLTTHTSPLQAAMGETA